MKYSIQSYEHIKQQTDDMSIDELLRAVICPDMVEGASPLRTTNAVFLHKMKADVARITTESINKGRSPKALIAADLEFGPGCGIENATEFPSMRGVAEAGNEKWAYEMGIITAKEARSAGYHWVFGPCVDIIGNKDNPIVGLRAPGETPEDAILYGGAYMKGLQENGMIATLKHFPGDGYSQYDQHVTVTENPLSKEEWDASFGRVYQTLIDEGAMCIMPGHISLPAYDEIDQRTGLHPPATLSRKLLTELLKEKLGFEGLIISDAISMGGFAGYMNLYEACATFLEAGGDCILFMKDREEYYSEMKKCISSGLLKEETLRNRAYRMLCFAYEYFEKNEGKELPVMCRCEAEKVSREVSRNCIKVARNRANTIPARVDKNTSIAHVVLHNMWHTDFTVVEEMTRKLSEIAGKVTEFRDPGTSLLKKMAKSEEYDLIICSVLEQQAYGLNHAKLCGPIARNMMDGWMRYQTPVVFIGYYDPYFGDVYQASVDTLIYSYGYTGYTIDGIIDTITGNQ